jgi:prophage tail gpP-like protein
MSELKLKINEVSYTGFEYVDIFKTMQSMCGRYNVTLHDIYKGGNALQDIRINDECIIEINDQVILTGYVDAMPVEYGKDYCWLHLAGRDNIQDLIDCSYDFTPNEWKEQTIQSIITSICNNFSITVAIDDSATTETNIIIESFKANEGQAVWEIISELCHDNGLLAVCYGDGNLTLTKVRSEYATDGILNDVNIDTCLTEQSTEDRYSSIKVKGQGIETDNKALGDYISCFGVWEDEIVTRNRPLVLFSDLPTTYAKAKKRAIWESRIRAGLSRKIIYQVPGWVQSDGNVWDINKLVNVEDEILGINETKLIMSVNYLFDQDGGEITHLVIVDRNTFNNSEDEIRIKSVFDRE